MSMLYSCPFCSHKILAPHVHELRAKTTGGYHYFVRCPRSHTEGPRSLSSKAEAIAAWNRRAIPQANAEQDARQFLQTNDLATLHRFMDFCTDSDAGGYSIPKERMQRLAEIGAIESKGFGRYQVTTFGLYVLTMDAYGSANLPLKTYAEYDADCMAAHEAKIFGGAASNATRGSDQT